MTNLVAREHIRKVLIVDDPGNTTTYGWFHCWTHNKQDELCAVVEIEDGTVHYYSFLSYHIVFIDNFPEITQAP